MVAAPYRGKIWPLGNSVSLFPTLPPCEGQSSQLSSRKAAEFLGPEAAGNGSGADRPCPEPPILGTRQGRPGEGHQALPGSFNSLSLMRGRAGTFAEGCWLPFLSPPSPPPLVLQSSGLGGTPQFTNDTSAPGKGVVWKVEICVCDTSSVRLLVSEMSFKALLSLFHQ